MLVNASGMLRMLGQPIFWKIAKPRSFDFSEEAVFAKMMCSVYQTDITAKTEMTARTTRRYHVSIRISIGDGIYESMSCFSRKPRFPFFFRADSFHHEIMFWLEGAEVEDSYFKQKNYHPTSPRCCLTNSVNSCF